MYIKERSHFNKIESHSSCKNHKYRCKFHLDGLTILIRNEKVLFDLDCLISQFLFCDINANAMSPNCLQKTTRNIGKECSIAQFYIRLYNESNFNYEVFSLLISQLITLIFYMECLLSQSSRSLVDFFHRLKFPCSSIGLMLQFHFFHCFVWFA